MISQSELLPVSDFFKRSMPVPEGSMVQEKFRLRSTSKKEEGEEPEEE